MAAQSRRLAYGEEFVGRWTLCRGRHKQHKTANVTNALPKSAQPGAKKALADIYNALARGARTGVRSTLISAAAKTASNAAVNFASRSRTRNRNWPTRSSRPMSRLRAC